MGFFTKLIKTAVVTGAAVGGVMYCKNRKETRDTEEKVDLTGVKPFEFEQDEEKITVSVNKNKIKDYADQAADKAIDAADTAQEKITDKLGEEKVEEIKEKYDVAKNKVIDAASKAATVASEKKDAIIEKIGEERIEDAKQKAKDAFDTAVDAVNEKVITPIKDKFNEESDFVDDIEVPVQDTPVKPEENKPSSIKADDFLEDELDDM